MPNALALASAILVGSADFFGGLASRRGDAYAVVTWAHAVGVGLTAILAALLPGLVTPTGLGWGAASGVAASLGVLSLYRGFAVGRVAVVAPVSAVVAAGLPIVTGVALGERPGTIRMIGLGLGLAAIWLVSRPVTAESDERRATGLRFGIGAGVGFAGLFILLSFSGDDAGLWPLLAGRITGGVTIAVIAMATGRGLVLAQAARASTVAAGSLAAIGNGAFLLAVQEGMLSVVAVLTSLYPAATVVLARIVFHERLGAGQIAGLGLALLAVSLIALG